MPYRPQNKARFRISLLIILYFTKVLKLISRFRKPSKSILVIKIDAIGDYIIFRNYLEVLKKCEKYKDFSIDLLGNVQWKQLAEEYDAEFVDNFIFIQEDLLYENPSELLKLCIKLFKKNYHTVFQPTYSKSLMGNALSAFAAAKRNVGFFSDNEHDPKYKVQTDNFYTHLIHLPDKHFHELDRNHFFFREALNDETLAYVTPTLPTVKNRDGILMFPGSSNFHRNWEKEKFSELLNRLIKTTSENIILAGGESEAFIAEFIEKESLDRTRVLNKAGRTTIIELVDLIASSKLTISNDTSAVHIAAATRTPVICIQGGGHFERFTPYPVHADFKPVCIYEFMACYNCNWQCKYMSPDLLTFPCISAVTTDAVWKVLTDNLAFQTLNLN